MLGGIGPAGFVQRVHQILSNRRSWCIGFIQTRGQATEAASGRPPPSHDCSSIPLRSKPGTCSSLHSSGPGAGNAGRGPNPYRIQPRRIRRRFGSAGTSSVSSLASLSSPSPFDALLTSSAAEEEQGAYHWRAECHMCINCNKLTSGFGLEWGARNPGGGYRSVTEMETVTSRDAAQPSLGRASAFSVVRDGSLLAEPTAEGLQVAVEGPVVAENKA